MKIKENEYVFSIMDFVYKNSRWMNGNIKNVFSFHM